MPYLALLRGVNVGGKNKLSMEALAKTFADHGCLDVRTYIQSGNVLFRAPARSIERLSTTIHEAIRDRFGLDVPVILRSLPELDAVVAGNPFLAAGDDTAKLHVAFLAARPTAAQIAALDVNRSPPDAFRVVGREIYLRLPNGAGGTKLSNAYFDRVLATTSTMRNWRTVAELHRRLVT
jgi:uncharacterized protein (DUF1697 family)